jgi:hypothetical protein
VFGRCKDGSRIILLYVYSWIKPRRLRDAVYRLVQDHECGHAWGLPGHHNPFCLMWEGPGRVRDTWVEKVPVVFLAPLGRLVRGDWLCARCRKELANERRKA